jgi:hypothetical protein
MRPMSRPAPKYAAKMAARSGRPTPFPSPKRASSCALRVRAASGGRRSSSPSASARVRTASTSGPHSGSRAGAGCSSKDRKLAAIPSSSSTLASAASVTYEKGQVKSVNTVAGTGAMRHQ